MLWESTDVTSLWYMCPISAVTRGPCHWDPCL